VVSEGGPVAVVEDVDREGFWQMLEELLGWEGLA
jgi:hypothetical protein